MPSDRREFSDKQLEEEHALFRLHIVIRMMDRKTIALKKFTYR